MSTEDALAARVQELEIKFTEQQRLLDELSEAVFSQHRHIDNLTHGLTLLKQKLDAGPGAIDGTVDEKPPHY